MQLWYSEADATKFVRKRFASEAERQREIDAEEKLRPLDNIGWKPKVIYVGDDYLDLEFVHGHTVQKLIEVGGGLSAEQLETALKQVGVFREVGEMGGDLFLGGGIDWEKFNL